MEILFSLHFRCFTTLALISWCCTLEQLCCCNYVILPCSMNLFALPKVHLCFSPILVWFSDLCDSDMMSEHTHFHIADSTADGAAERFGGGGGGGGPDICHYVSTTVLWIGNTTSPENDTHLYIYTCMPVYTFTPVIVHRGNEYTYKIWWQCFLLIWEFKVFPNLLYSWRMPCCWNLHLLCSFSSCYCL